MAQQDEVNLSEPVVCPKCGSTELRYDPDSDENPVICNKCGHDFGKLGEVKESVRNNAATRYAADSLKQKLPEAFEGDSDVTFQPD
jgi:hypothetical protein